MSVRPIHWDRWLPLSILLLFMTTIASSKVSVQPAVPAFVPGDLVGHAMGGIGLKTYTNSVDAFTANYRQGRRTFETDLIFTGDGQLVGMHDWSPETQARLGLSSSGPGEAKPPAYREFMKRRILNRYAPIDVKKLVSLLRTHEDARIITDTKSTDGPDVARAFETIVAEAKRRDASVLDRIIPQVYNQAMYETVEAVHPFRSIIYALYLSSDSDDEVMRFVKAKSIPAVSMPMERASARFIARLKAAGVYVYVHTINDPNMARTFFERGADGIYTDFLIPESFSAPSD